LADAHRGTISDLARVFWVKVLKYSPELNRAFIRTLSEEELSKAQSVKVNHGAWIEADVLYPLLRGRDTGRYASSAGNWHQIVPNRHYTNFDSQAFEATYPLAFQYLMGYAEQLGKRATYKRYLQQLPIYSIYCVGDYSFAPYKVAWPEQQDPQAFRAAVIGAVGEQAIIPNRVVVPDHKLYFVASHSLDEAHYLCAFLNSRPVRQWLGGFLLSRQIGTSIFEFMRLPRFDAQSVEHQRLVRISQDAHAARQGQVETALLSGTLEDETDQIVQAIVSGQDR
jgi:hypothetical protein